MDERERARCLFRQIESTGFHKYGCIRIHKETKKHFLAKCEKAWELHELGHNFATEVKMKNGDIYDICDLMTGEHWEFETNIKEDKNRGERVQL